MGKTGTFKPVREKPQSMSFVKRTILVGNPDFGKYAVESQNKQ